MVRFCAIALLSLGLLFAAPRADAGEAMRARLDDTTASGATFADLLRMIVPDLAQVTGGYAGTRIVPLRHVAGADHGGATPERFIVDEVPVVAFGDGDRARLLMLLDLGRYADYAEGLAVLALFDMVGTPRMLDVVDVAYARDSFFATPASLSMTAESELIFTSSTHSNSNQAYLTTAILSAERDRLELVDVLSLFAEHSCAGEMTQTKSFSRIDAHAFQVDVVVEIIPGDAECDAPPLEASRREISVLYRRDGAGSRYAVGSDALERLAIENQGRF